jgi:hypothetical protein
VRVIVAGSRDLDTDELPIWLVADAVYKSGWKDQITEIVSGGCRGIDLAGEQFASDYKIPVKKFNPDWSLGKKAGPIRNQQMADYADALVLIWSGTSRGSADMKKKAELKGLKIYEYLVK